MDLSEELKKDWVCGCGTELDGSDLSTLKGRLKELESTHVAEPKFDGFYGTVWGLPTGNKVLSKNMEKQLCLPLLSEGTALVGELGMGTQSAVEVARKLGHDFINVFDILFYKGGACWRAPRCFRRDLLEEWYWKTCSAEQREFFLLAPQFRDGFYSHFLREREGLVLKPRVGGSLLVGQKDPEWVKVKKQKTSDMILMGWTPSESESFAGLAKSVQCGMLVGGELRELVSVGSMTQEWRRRFSEHFEEYKGRVVEIAHFGQFKSGSLRHPSFVGMREDKRPEECVLSLNLQ